jgi:hypothetical protein
MHQSAERPQWEPGLVDPQIIRLLQRVNTMVGDQDLARAEIQTVAGDGPLDPPTIARILQELVTAHVALERVHAALHGIARAECVGPAGQRIWVATTPRADELVQLEFDFAKEGRT